MKTNILKQLFLLILPAIAYSCLDDLNTQPLDQNLLVSKDVYNKPEGYQGVLAKCYASLIQTGQQGGDGGNGDVAGIDEGYSGYTRALFYLQTSSTDEIVLHAGSSHGTQAALFLNWDPSTKIISYPYYRLYMAINYCNEFLRECTEGKLKERGVYEALKTEYPFYCAEARFIRAYCYTMLCDLYGSAPFVDETMSVGVIPHQKTRNELYQYALSEAEAIKELLHKPKQNQYGRVDQTAAWFLLTRLYLNAETWIGKANYTEAYTYAKRIITDNSYPLAPDYRHIFLADNQTCSEIIWPLVQDADQAQSSAGTNFQLKALANGDMNSYIGLNNSWGNARVKTQLVNLFNLSDQTFDPADPWGDLKADKRAQFFTLKHTKETWVANKDFQKDFYNGYATLKWRNLTKERTPLIPGGTKYASIDFPLFRTSDAYLMASEAILRGATNGTPAEALHYLNQIRDRAYLAGDYGPNQSAKITLDQLTLDFLIDERGRELHTELTRRTDLIRFNKYTKNYHWDWKGSNGMAGNYVGKEVDSKYNLFPIPQDEFTVNPNLTQNPDYQ